MMMNTNDDRVLKETILFEKGKKTGSVEMVGWLVKMGKKKSNAKPRWFVLKNYHLNFYESPKDVEKQGVIRITDVFNVRWEEGKKESDPCFFELHTKSKIWKLKAMGRDSANGWVQAIKQNLMELGQTLTDSQKNKEYYSKCEMAGYLSRLNSTGKRSWRRRWFVLQGHSIYQFRTDQCSSLLATIRLHDAEVRPEPVFDKLNAFEIITEERVYKLSAESVQERDQWVNMIENNAVLFAERRQAIKSAKGTSYLLKRRLEPEWDSLPLFLSTISIPPPIPFDCSFYSSFPDTLSFCPYRSEEILFSISKLEQEIKCLESVDKVIEAPLEPSCPCNGPEIFQVKIHPTTVEKNKDFGLDMDAEGMRSLSLQCNRDDTCEKLIDRIATRLHRFRPENSSNPSNYVLKILGKEEYVNPKAVVSQLSHVHYTMNHMKIVEFSLLDRGKLMKKFPDSFKERKKGSIRVINKAKKLKEVRCMAFSHQSLQQHFRFSVVSLSNVDINDLLNAFDSSVKLDKGELKLFIEANVSAGAKRIGNVMRTTTQVIDIFKKVGSQTQTISKSTGGVGWGGFGFGKSGLGNSMGEEEDEGKEGEEKRQRKNSLKSVKKAGSSTVLIQRTKKEVPMPATTNEPPPDLSSPTMSYNSSTISSPSILNSVSSPLFPTLYFKKREKYEWDEALFCEIPMSNIPRSSTLHISLWGQIGDAKVLYSWININIFDFQGFMVAGSQTIPMWRQSKFPSTIVGSLAGNTESICPLLEVKFMCPPSAIRFDDSIPKDEFDENYKRSHRRTSRRVHKQLAEETIRELSQRDPLSRLTEEEKVILWKHRFDFVQICPESLVMIAKSISWTSPSQVRALHLLIQRDCPLCSPKDALRLLDFQFTDYKVREYAVKCLERLTDSELVSILLQLVQGLKFEPYLSSPLFSFLVRRAVQNKKLIGQTLFWHLYSEVHNDQLKVLIEIFLNGLRRSLPDFFAEMEVQASLVDQINSVAKIVRNAPSSKRNSVARSLLASISIPSPSPPCTRGTRWDVGYYRNKNSNRSENVDVQSKNDLNDPSKYGVVGDDVHIGGNEDDNNNHNNTFLSLPVNPSFGVRGLHVDKCKVMDSFTTPLWLSFENADPNAPPIEIIYKVGDDLRQDYLTLQMIRIMDDMWKREGLDLRMTPYMCMVTGEMSGMIQVVPKSTTSANIHKLYGGASAAFKSTPLASYFREKYTSKDLWSKAIENFTLSLAGYCVASFILGLGDRHNDNIMISDAGHLFHIDFGHFLGHIVKFGFIKRESAPFVLTPEFVNAIGGKKSQQYQEFTKRCCEAYNIVRHNSNSFINLFLMMISTGIPQLQKEDDLLYLKNAFALGVKTDKEASALFTKLIEESLSTKRTQFLNFFHILANPD